MIGGQRSEVGRHIRDQSSEVRSRRTEEYRISNIECRSFEFNEETANNEQ